MTWRRARRFGAAAIAVIVAVALVALAAFMLFDRAAPIFYARIVDDRTLALGTVTGPATWTRVTLVRESPDTIIVALSSLSAPIPGYGDDLTELAVHLSAAIGKRSVTDANTGHDVPLTTCRPPAYLAPGCTQP